MLIRVYRNVEMFDSKKKGGGGRGSLVSRLIFLYLKFDQNWRLYVSLQIHLAL